MPYKFFVIPFDEGREAFSDIAFEKFTDSVRVKELRSAFFHKGGNVYWTVFLAYEGLSEKLSRPADLSESELTRYQALREWRNHKASDEGMPPYIIASNRQLAAFSKIQEPLLSALESINGFGKAKAEKYGVDILALLNQYPIQKVESANNQDETTGSTPF